MTSVGCSRGRKGVYEKLEVVGASTSTRLEGGSAASAAAAHSLKPSRVKLFSSTQRTFEGPTKPPGAAKKQKHAGA